MFCGTRWNQVKEYTTEQIQVDWSNYIQHFQELLGCVLLLFTVISPALHTRKPKLGEINVSKVKILIINIKKDGIPGIYDSCCAGSQISIHYKELTS